MSENVLLNKSFEFAVGIVQLYKKLIWEQKEYCLAKQILRSGTSIGSNIEEAKGSISKKEFIANVHCL